MKESNIEIKNARQHNLKGFDLKIPHNKFVVISGLSGSGKSSLAFDTLYAEGQRRYVESLSSYIRQFMGRMNKPEVDYISGLPPAIAIQQKVINNNPRSTVGTSTEIYEYLKLLFARVGKTVSPVSGNIVKRHDTKDIIDFVIKLPSDTEVYLLSPIILPENRELEEHLRLLQQQGFNRVFVDNQAIRISLFLETKEKCKKDVMLFVDKVRNDGKKETLNRLTDSIGVALFEGHNSCELIYFIDDKKHKKRFSQNFEEDGIVFKNPSVDMFSFNNPQGACQKCEGFGKVIGISEELVVPDKSLSVFQDAVVCWRSPSAKEWKEALINTSSKFNFPIHKPYFELTKEEKYVLWNGNQYFGGINQYFEFAESQQYKVQYRVLLSRYRGVTLCPECKGTKLKNEASYVKLFFSK